MKILAFYTDGNEDAEFVITVDLLRRARIECLTVSADDKDFIYTSHNICTKPEAKLKDLSDEEIMSFDGLFIPGGKIGVENLSKNDRLLKIIKKFHDSNKLVSAICAAPTVLSKAGIMSNHKFTCYDGWESLVDGIYEKAMPYVVDKNVITGRSLNYSVDFTLQIIEYLTGSENKEKVAKGILKV